MNQTYSHYDPGTGTLRTVLTGSVTSADVERWAEGFRLALDSVPDGAAFKLFVDLHGFEPENIAAHKLMREVVPRALAAHGMRPAFLDLFDDQPEAPIECRRGVRCVAFANVHHDAAKMANYEAHIATRTQRFFTDRAVASAWLAAIA